MVSLTPRTESIVGRLVPFIASPRRSTGRRAVNALVWVATLLSLVLVAQVIVALGINLGKAGLFERLGMHWPLELCLSFIGVVFAWVLVLIFVSKWGIKKWRKARKKKQPKSPKTDKEPLKGVDPDYGAVPAEEVEALEPSLTTDVFTVVPLTIAGGIDEVAYFPSLLLTHTFTLWEMAAGTVLAALVLLVVLLCFLARCTPVLEAMDKIPLWVVVGVFASIMTVMFVFEFFEQ